MRSVRTRLTIAITLLAAAGSLAAVFWGTQLMERQLTNRALDDYASVLVDNDLGDLFFPGEFVLFPDEVFFSESGGISEEEFAAEFGEEFGKDFTDEFGEDGFFFDDEEALEEILRDNISQLELSLLTLRDTAVLDEVFDEFDPDDDGVFHAAWTPDASIAISRDAVFLDRTVGATDAPVVTGVDALMNISFLHSGIDGFIEGAGDDLKMAFAVRESGEYRVGLVADATALTNNVDQIRNSLWVAAGILTLLAGAATWILTGRALAPVAAMTRQVGEISAGNLSERIPVHNEGDEIGGLATTMNTMLGRIDSSTRQRRQFVSDAAHELRTPVAVLRSEAEVALKAPGFTDVDQLATAVLEESDRLGVLVEDLLMLARFDEGRAGSGTQVVDVDEVVFAEAGRTRAIPVDRRQVSAGRVRGRADDLGRLTAHLLNNAVRHAESQVAIGVQVDEDGSAVRLWVDDDGDGIPAAEREKVFERFVRLEEARSRDTGGSGLGLAVVKAIVEDHGGAVEVGESSFGGARFVVTLPAA